MKTKEKLGRFKFKLSLLVLLTFMGVATWSCSDDEVTSGPTGPDTRLEGKDLVLMLHDNPATKAPYTADELAALGYDPGVQDSFPSSYKSEMLIWTQQRPLRVEVFKDGTDELVTMFETSARDDRPDLASYKEGYGYSTKWKFKAGELGLSIEDPALFVSQTYNIKVTYHDQGIDGFQTSSVKEIKFTVIHIKDKTVGTLADFLVGYWRFNDPSNLLKATVGNDLVLGGAASHSATPGSTAGDGAAHLDIGTWYDVLDHGISDSYTMVWDVMVASDDLGKYIPLWQNNVANDSDGALYINPSDGFWFNGGTSDFGGTIKADTWHRIIASYDAGDLLFYVDGVEIYSTSLSWPVDASKLLLFGENSSNNGNGEDNPINVSEVMIFSTAFSAADLAKVPALGTPAVETIAASLKGRWKFDNTSNLLEASCGNDLVLAGAASHTSVTGARDGDGAAHLDVGTWYDVVNHGLGDNYSFIWDVMVAEDDLGTYIPLFQNNSANDSDGAVYINPSAGFWFNGGASDFGGTIVGGQWHRIVASYENGNLLFYVDGQEIYITSLSWALDPAKLLLFGENSSNNGNGEDNPITVSEVMIFDRAFTADQIEAIPLIEKPAL